MRWCKVFPGQEDQIPCVRTFVSQLLADHPDRADIVMCAAELAANAVRHTASGRDGFFATEVTWPKTWVSDQSRPEAVDMARRWIGAKQPA